MVILFDANSTLKENLLAVTQNLHHMVIPTNQGIYQVNRNLLTQLNAARGGDHELQARAVAEVFIGMCPWLKVVGEG